MRCLQLLSAHGIAVPATVMARSAGDLKAMVQLVGGVPVLVKLLGGGDERGVMVCETLNSLEAALEAILGLGHNLLVQEYVRKKGRDVRVLVVGRQGGGGGAATTADEPAGPDAQPGRALRAHSDDRGARAGWRWRRRG